MTRTELRDGVFLTEIEDKRFKKQEILISLSAPLTRETLTQSALLTYMFARGTRDLPDMTLLARRLAYLYGAQLTRGASSYGFCRAVYAWIDGIVPRCSPEQSLTGDYVRIALDTLFDPTLKDGEFDSEWTKIEKQKLADAIAAEYDSKRYYCFTETMARFFGEADVRSLPDCGLISDLASITPRSLAEYYRALTENARVEIVSIGERIDRSLFDGIAPRLSPEISKPIPVKPRETERLEISDQVNQQKITMCYTTGRMLDFKERAAFHVGSALFGGVQSSRLFMKIREKKGLCYSCGAAPELLSGILTVDGGVAFGKEQRFVDSVERELGSIARGHISKRELHEAKLALKGALMGAEDNSQALMRWYYGQIAAGQELLSPSDYIADVERVTADEVAAAMSELHLNVIGSFARGNA